MLSISKQDLDHSSSSPHDSATALPKEGILHHHDDDSSLPITVSKDHFCEQNQKLSTFSQKVEDSKMTQESLEFEIPDFKEYKDPEIPQVRTQMRSFQKYQRIENTQNQFQPNQYQNSCYQKMLLLKPISLKPKIHIFENMGRKQMYKAILLPICQKSEKQMQECFFNSIHHEYQVSRNISHPNIINYSDFIPELSIYGNRYSMVEMPKFKGSLEKLVKENKQKIQLSQIKTWFKLLLGLLVYLQQQGISHNQIHPSNLLVDTNEENIVLSNLKFVNKQSSQSAADTLSKWTTQQPTEYVGPEILAFLNRQITNFDEMKNDTYQLSMIFFELIFDCIPSKQRFLSQERAQLCNLFKFKETQMDYQQDLQDLFSWMQKVIQLQEIQNLRQKNNKYNQYTLEEIQNMATFFLQALSISPTQRSSPQDLLNHKWMQF